MKYVIAVIACGGLFLLYAVIGASLGWRHAGGAIPMGILLSVMGAVWVAIIRFTPSDDNTKKETTSEPQPPPANLTTTDPSPSPKTTPKQITEIENSSPRQETRVNTDAYYEQALEEIETAHLHKATWAKAFAEESGDEAKAKALYIKLRVERLTEDIVVSQAPIAEIKHSFREMARTLSSTTVPDMDHVPSDNYEGDPSTLSDPIPITEAEIMTGLLAFQIIDLIKTGTLRGVRNGEDWFVDGVYIDVKST